MKSENAFSLEGLANLANLANYSRELTYHDFTLAELEAEAADDWQEVKDNPDALEAFAHAMKTSRTRQRGEKPDHYTKVSECTHCGPVWLWESAPDVVRGCPWCLHNGRVPRPGPVLCRDCENWKPDTINPSGGLGKCICSVPGLAWPGRELDCDKFSGRRNAE